MPPGVNGIHHITAIAGNAQKNIDFYTKILGLKLVKKTVNFDDPYTYHFYYGNENGSPGTILTFFPWGNKGSTGRRGSGQITAISFSVPENSISFWKERLKKFDINVSDSFKRFGEEAVQFEDADGFQIELVASSNDERNGWNNGDIPEENSIRGFHSAALSEVLLNKTEEMLISLLGFRKTAEENNRYRYESGSGGPGNIIDILVVPDLIRGIMGVGAIHHIAFRASDNNHQLEIKKLLEENNVNVTPVINRNYFHSIYFREPGNVLFEAATDPPGFLIDEDKELLGKQLKLPDWYEPKRIAIEKALPPVKF